MIASIGQFVSWILVAMTLFQEKKDNCSAKLKKCLSLNLGLANFHCIHTGKLAC
jgi:hypothetical protein